MPANFLVAGMARSYTNKIVVTFNANWNYISNKRCATIFCSRLALLITSHLDPFFLRPSGIFTTFLHSRD
jgi:hypothetical protein